jgi:hypothetical protein
MAKHAADPSPKTVFQEALASLFTLMHATGAREVAE